MCTITAAEYEALKAEAMRGREGCIEKVYAGFVDATFDDWGSTRLLRSRFAKEDQHFLAAGKPFWMESGQCRLRRNSDDALVIRAAGARCEAGGAPCGYHRYRLELRAALDEYQARHG